MPLDLRSSAFPQGQPIPKQYTGDGQNISPPLQWSDPPDQTQSFALICDDPDAPRGTWVHWVLFNVPADLRGLPEGVPTERELENGAKQGKNDFGNIGYGGPAPPKGKPHRYFFKLYALDTNLNLPAGASKQMVSEAIHGHVLAEGQWLATYQR